MGNEDLTKLENICSTLEQFRATTEDGNGQNLHDIKNTFDYVKKTAEQYNLSGTTFGDSLISKVEGASNVLSELWTNFKNLEDSIHNFVDSQRKNNSSESVTGGVWYQPTSAPAITPLPDSAKPGYGRPPTYGGWTAQVQ